MRVFGLFLLSTLLVLVKPAMAAEYQGKNIDGRKLTGKAYFSQTGGVYNVQVLFKKNRATIYFANGGQTTIKLRHQVIADPSDIEGVGGLGQYYLGGLFSVGLVQGDNSIGNNLRPSESQTFQGFWRISLDL